MSISVYSYIKPQLIHEGVGGRPGCLSVYSYIKPQLGFLALIIRFVVYLSIPTSNHNYEFERIKVAEVVYLSIPTSNHNDTT